MHYTNQVIGETWKTILKSRLTFEIAIGEVEHLTVLEQL